MAVLQAGTNGRVEIYDPSGLLRDGGVSGFRSTQTLALGQGLASLFGTFFGETFLGHFSNAFQWTFGSRRCLEVWIKATLAVGQGLAPGGGYMAGKWSLSGR